jgi:hypothetical protein
MNTADCQKIPKYQSRRTIHIPQTIPQSAVIRPSLAPTQHLRLLRANSKFYRRRCTVALPWRELLQLHPGLGVKYTPAILGSVFRYPRRIYGSGLGDQQCGHKFNR